MNVENCSAFQELISAEFDGELDEREQVELQRHLSDCPSCRGWLANCRHLGDQIESVARMQPELDWPIASTLAINGNSPRARELETATSEYIVPKPTAKPHAKSNQASRWFWGIAAVLLVAIGMSFGVFSRPKPATATYSIEPLIAMHAINLQAEHDQQATVRAVAMELRMMKLEMKQFALEPDAREQMERRIDSLLTKTRELDASTQVLYQGE